MRVTLRREWRPRALESFLGFLDIKTGVSIVVLFALFNKVAGFYGLIAIFSGGSLAQISLYVYSVIALGVFSWGLKAIAQEDPKRTFYFAHAFLADHLLNTIWTIFFAVAWWYWNPHDGKRIANSAAQKQVMESGGPAITDEDRTRQAQQIWNKEKGFAATVLIVGWLLKIYFASLVYSYAIHLRRGSYRSLPLANPSPESYRTQGNIRDYELIDEEESFPMPRRGPALPAAHRAASPRRRPNGLNLNSSGPGRPTSKIMQDSEVPGESVLWDEEGEVEASGRVPVMTNMSSPYGYEDGSDIVASTGSDESDYPYTHEIPSTRYR